MEKLNPDQIQEYLHRSYTAVDGLWFMKVEEKEGFQNALDIDIAVWKILPKIQARLLKSFFKVDQGLDAFEQCFATKLTLDKYAFNLRKMESGLEITIHNCHWYNLIVKSGRDGLFMDIAHQICNTEFNVFSREFGENIQIEQQTRMCEGAESCGWQFIQGKPGEEK